jgi:hypothetical protein
MVRNRLNSQLQSNDRHSYVIGICHVLSCRDVRLRPWKTQRGQVQYCSARHMYGQQSSVKYTNLGSQRRRNSIRQRCVAKKVLCCVVLQLTNLAVRPALTGSTGDGRGRAGQAISEFSYPVARRGA